MRASAVEQTVRLLRRPHHGGTRGLISRRTVMEQFDFPSLDAVRMFAKRRGIVHIMLGGRALYDPRDWEVLKAPAVGVVGHGKTGQGAA